MKLSFNPVTNHNVHYKGPKTNQPTADQITSVLKAYILILSCLGRELQEMVEVIKIGFYQDQFDYFPEPIFTAILSTGEIDSALGKLKVEPRFGAKSLMTRGACSPEHPLPFVDNWDMTVGGYVFPPELMAEHFVLNIKKAIKNRVSLIISELNKVTEKAK